MTNGSAVEGRTCRAARALLNWSARRLATQSGASIQTIFDLERERVVSAEDLLKLERAFSRAGVIILMEQDRGVGVRLAPETRDRSVKPTAIGDHAQATVERTARPMPGSPSRELT